MLKDIVERPSGSANPPTAPQAPAPGSTGFPVAAHRSQRPSAFARARQQQQAKQDGRGAVAEGRAVASIPSLRVSQSTVPDSSATLSTLSEVDRVQREVDGENISRVEAMSDAEREQEVAELTERFGTGIADLMRRRKAAREAKEGVRYTPDVSQEGSSSRQILNEAPAVDAQSTQQILEDVSRENWQKVKAMSENEREGEVQELEERFGSKLIDALRARAENRLAKGKERAMEYTEELPVLASSCVNNESTDQNSDAPSPSAIKAKYFPTVPAEPSKLEWLQPPSSTPASSTSDKTTRFDLSGKVLSDSAKNSLPTHLGLHHHGASPDLAGYTLQDILYLCRSTVPSQRITMMGVLARIISQLRAESGDSSYSAEVKQECAEAKAITTAIALGVEILTGLTRGMGVIRAGIDLLFEALGGPTWTWLDADDLLPRAFDPKVSTDEPTGISAIPFEDVLPRMKELLSIEGGVDPSTAQQLIVILRRATLISPELCETLSSIVPIIVRQHVVQKPWPPKNDNYPSVDALRLLRDITTSSRACAEELLQQGVYETTLRFVVTATWTATELGDSAVDIIAIGQTLAIEVLHSYRALGRYGLGSSVVGASAEVWRRLGAWVSAKVLNTSTTTSLESQLITAYFDCLSIWITCSIDPHRTTPEHDITWAQISALGWAEEALVSLKDLIKAKRWRETSSALHLLVAWLNGAQVNAVRGGQAEKAAVLNGLSGARLGGTLTNTEDEGMTIWRIETIAGAVELHNLTSSEGELLPAQVLDKLRDEFSGDDASACGSAKSSTDVRYQLLRGDIANDAKFSWWSEAIRLMPEFQLGDEPLALDLVDSILRHDWKSTNNRFSEQLAALTHPDGLQLLRPLLQYHVLPDVEHIVGPRQPVHLYLKATATLRSPSTDGARELGKAAMAGLPLQRDWVFSPLNELLRSGDSIALSQVPPDWSASETEIVLATLLLAQLATTGSASVGRSYVLLNLIKVFMLEHGQHSASTTSESEVFRETKVAAALQALMAPLCESPTSPNTLIDSEPAPLERVAEPFLGPGVPFYQFFTDFLALYEAISFSEPLFTQLLLPPLAMSYPPDYRKLLWNDHSTALRGMRTRLHEVPLESPQGSAAYFQPLESNTEVLHGYARALLRGWVTEERNEFLFTLAAHHLIGLFWHGTEENKESARVGLLIMLLSGGTDALIARIIGWDLDSVGKEQLSAAEKERRTEIVSKLTGAKGASRVERLP